MGRLNISNLARETGVSRPTIYKRINCLGIGRKAEYTPEEYDRIKNAVSGVASIQQRKREDVAGVRQSERKARMPTETTSEALTDEKRSTLLKRLELARQEYNYNRKLINCFQRETDEYIAANGKTTMENQNGTLSPIPSVTSLEKYVKLNIALSRLISDLEKVLDLAHDDDGEDDPFG